MLVTGLTLVAFYLVAGAFVVGGYAAKNEGILVFGAVLLIILGGFVFDQGITEKIGENQTTCGFYDTLIYGDNYTSYHWDYDFSDAPGCTNPNDFTCVNLFHINRSTKDCVETTMNIYEQNKGYLSNGLGSLSMIIGALLLFYLYDMREQARKRYESGE